MTRPKNWVKNIFIFVPLVFSLNLLNVNALLATVVAFASFCLISSAVYIFNDICDAAKDAAHPVKRSRPIASGLISKSKAAVLAILLALAGIAVGFTVNIAVMMLVTAYLALNILYSAWLKHVPVFDCFSIAAGFVLRVYAGGAASGETVSDWLFLTIAAMSLFMAFGKRRGEFSRVRSAESRDVLRRYDIVFLQGMVWICAGLSIVFYSLWALNREHNMVYTVPLIIFLVSRYLLRLSDPDSHGDPTTVLFKDKVLLAAGGVYGLLTVFLLYFQGRG